MQKVDDIPVYKIPDLNERLIWFARKFPMAAIYNSNSNHTPISSVSYTNYDLVAGFARNSDSPSSIKEFRELGEINENNPHWYLGYLTYDVKNSIENLNSSHPDEMGWPSVLFFIPDILFLQKDGRVTIISTQDDMGLDEFFNEEFRSEQEYFCFNDLNLIPRMKKEEYLWKLAEIQKEINRGNIYEINFCQEFFNTIKIDPYAYFLKINANTKSPFASFFKFKNRFLLSASPERFLMKNHSKIISQPIKGTAHRSESPLEDELLRTRLISDPKERAENIMIVDLVRNDLSKIALKDTVKVEELCEVYSFPYVHQMISTISAEIHSVSFLDIMKATFPMGSMTGTPKVSSMKSIENYETVKRGLYSGTVGYITPEMNFDFSVIIRSLQYNAANNYVSYLTGSAITAMSDPEKEYDECLLKAYAISSNQKKKTYA
jgi:para-aminobenzoate synthetase component I